MESGKISRSESEQSIVVPSQSHFEKQVFLQAPTSVAFKQLIHIKTAFIAFDRILNRSYTS